jgi:hypothetical protein
MQTSRLDDGQWRALLGAARTVLGRGASLAWGSESWCAWTTFQSLKHGVHYWACGLPEQEELLETRTSDGGTWMQSFSYDDIAHLLLPRKFYWERVGPGMPFENGYKRQNIDALSKELTHMEIDHRLTELVLEVKLY